MRKSLLDTICCPICAQPLTIHGVRAEGAESDEVVEGELRCTACLTLYPIRKGIPNLLAAKLLEEYKKQEMQGWVSLWEKKGMYARPTLEDSFQLPYLGGIWTEVARMFELALTDMNLTGNETILEIGAGQGWASRYFAAKGCRVIAIDIVDDEWYGLGRSWAIMQRAGVYFEPLLADGEHPPFFPGTFDMVFLCGALHHFKDFQKVLPQVYKLLKPGGQVVATGEPSVSVITPERVVQGQLEETHEGIVERRPKVFEYWWKFHRAGFQKVHIDVFETYNASALQVYHWIVSVRQNLFQHVRLRYKPLVWLVLSGMLLLPYRWAAQLTLYANGGNLLVRAVRPLVTR